MTARLALADKATSDMSVPSSIGLADKLRKQAEIIRQQNARDKRNSSRALR